VTSHAARNHRSSANSESALDPDPFRARRAARRVVLSAANDTIFSPEEIQATARVFPYMAHDMMLEAGCKSVADHILCWLQERGL